MFGQVDLFSEDEVDHVKIFKISNGSYCIYVR